ncbi:MAG: histidinol-phosphatase HisJ family protein [Halanaerobiales bacterium]
MSLVDLHTHPRAHGEEARDSSIWDEFIAAARKNGIQELGFSDHEWVLKQIDWEYIELLKRKSEIKIRSGLEVEYAPGREKEITRLKRELPLDYCIGSVHRIGDWTFDHPDYREEYACRNIDDIYSEYFYLVERAADSGLFDIIGHFDLIKIFGHRPQEKDILEMVEPVLQLIKEKDLVLEVNTNGLNKPVGEIYPSRRIIKYACGLGIPFTLGSDAHIPDRVGEGLKEAVEMLAGLGCKEIVSFERGKRVVIS